MTWRALSSRPFAEIQRSSVLDSELRCYPGGARQMLPKVIPGTQSVIGCTQSVPKVYPKCTQSVIGCTQSVPGTFYFWVLPGGARQMLLLPATS